MRNKKRDIVFANNYHNDYIWNSNTITSACYISTLYQEEEQNFVVIG